MLKELSNTELRLELAEAESERAKTWNGSWRKKNRVRDITRELLERGAF